MRYCAALLLGTACLLFGSAFSTAAPGGTDNIVVVLDASGSMNGRMAGPGGLTRMEAAKKALLAVLQQIPDSTNVGLLVFSASNLRDDWVYPLGPLDRAKFEAAIRLPQPGGPTPLGGYLKKGADALIAQRKKQQGFGTFRLLVVTDGEATDGNLVNVYLPDVLSRGITVDAIGVDMKQDHTLATRVHTYRRANSPEDLVKAVSAAFGEIGGSRDAVADAEAFEAIQGLPDDMARTMIAALAAPAEHPIGETPQRPSPEHYPATTPTSVPTPTTSWTIIGLLGSCLWWTAIGVFVVVVVVVASAKQVQKKGRKR